MRKSQDEYKLDRVYEYPNMTIRVFRPVITEEERARRMKEIEKAAIALVKSTMR